MPQPSGPLRIRNYRLLLSCNVISFAGTGVASVALPFAVLHIGGTATDVGLVVTAQQIPLIAFLLIGGVIADRLPRHQVIVAANALQAVMQGMAAALLLTGHAHVWQLAALAAGGGLARGFYMPAAQGLLPQTVPAHLRAQAVAMDRAARNAALIGGAALGGILVAVAGPGWGLAIDGASFAIAGLLRIGMRMPNLPPVQVASMVHDLREGWHEVSSRRWLWIIILQFSVLVGVAAGCTDVLGPLVADAQLSGAKGWGLILATYSFGAVAGGLLMTRWRPVKLLRAGMAAVPAFSLLLFALAVPFSVPVDMLLALMAGGSMEVFIVNWAVTLQQEIPPDRLSRVASYDALGMYGLSPIGTAVAGPMAAIFGIRAVLLFSGSLMIIFPCLVLLDPAVRRMRRVQHPGTDPADTPAVSANRAGPAESAEPAGPADPAAPAESVPAEP